MNQWQFIYIVMNNVCLILIFLLKYVNFFTSSVQILFHIKKATASNFVHQVALYSTLIKSSKVGCNSKPNHQYCCIKKSVLQCRYLALDLCTVRFRPNRAKLSSSFFSIFILQFIRSSAVRSKNKTVRSVCSHY